MTVALSLDRVGLRLAGKLIVDEVTFSVDAGEWVSIIGPNGAGKTSLLKCLNRIHPNISGSIRVWDRPLDSYPQRELARRVAYVPQAGGAHPGFSVEEFVLLARYPYLSPFSSAGEDDRRAADEALAKMGCAAFAHRSMGTLSGGERQKVILAAALAQGASILLLDEPATFLDYRHQVEILDRLRALRAESELTILAVTHDVNQALQDSDRIAALRDGELKFIASADHVAEEGVLENLFETRFERLHTDRGMVVVPRETFE